MKCKVPQNWFTRWIRQQTNLATAKNAQKLLVLEKYDEKDQLHVSLTLFSRNYSNKNIAFSQFSNLIPNVNIIQNYWEKAVFANAMQFYWFKQIIELKCNESSQIANRSKKKSKKWR